LALEINPEWNKRPYLGVADLVFKDLNNAFSAPRIYIVLAGYLANAVRLPA
jgi:hypothetical protein